MKRISVVVFIIIVSFLFDGCISRNKINKVFDTYEMETAQEVAYVYYDTFVLGDVAIDFSEIVEENVHGGAFHEVYVIRDDTIWFGYAEARSNAESFRKWNIASLNLDGSGFNICYSGEFCSGAGADKVYMHNNNHSKDGYKTDNGFYYEDKIVLTDRVKTVEYDLQTNTSTEFESARYEYPVPEIEAEIVDHQTVLISNGNEQKVFDVKQGKQNSKAFEKLYELEKQKNWEGKSYLSELFDKVQLVNNQIYIICRVLNWDGETHAIVFQYDYDTNSCKYAFHCFMGDIITNDLYVVPMI